MKYASNQLLRLRGLQFARFPKTPRVVILGAPNSGASLFAHRLAIDIGVPAVSMRDIYKNIITHEEQYKSEAFYRKVISLLKNYKNKSPEEMSSIQRELEENQIPEKLLTLTKYTELGFVLYDYPNTVRQAENLESMNGGINLFVNLLFNKELAQQREKGAYVCNGCHREYNKVDLVYKQNNILWPASYPKDGICVDCGSNDIRLVGNENSFEDKWTNYENHVKTILPFYQKLGLLLNFEVKNGLTDYEYLRQKVQYNIKH